MIAIAIDIKKLLPKFSMYAGAVLATTLGIFELNAGVQASNTTTPQATPAIPAQNTNKSAAKPAAPAKKHWYQIGRASWYGEDFQGQQTASGENYDMNDMTCAHRSLPLGSLIRVTNLRNHKTIVVRVNDRGPMPESRVVDLSYAAARFLGFSGRGTAPVRLDLVKSTTEVAQLNELLPQAAR